MGRTWIRLYCDKWLEGSLREESLDTRGAWADLLALAGSGKYSDSGEIKLTSNLGLTDEQVATMLRIPVDRWLSIKERLIETGRISCNSGNIIKITNWDVYQPKFDKTAYMRNYMQKRRAGPGKTNRDKEVNKKYGLDEDER